MTLGLFSRLFLYHQNEQLDSGGDGHVPMGGWNAWAYSRTWQHGQRNFCGIVWVVEDMYVCVCKVDEMTGGKIVMK